MKQRICIHPASGIEYIINSCDYGYSNQRSFGFCLIFIITIPHSEPQKDQEMRVTMELDTIMGFVKKHNLGMAKYILSTINGYGSKPDRELRAFKSLNKDGFDLFKIVEYVMTESDMFIEGYN
jgi:hypothetical protein